MPFLDAFPLNPRLNLNPVAIEASGTGLPPSPSGAADLSYDMITVPRRSGFLGRRQLI